MTITLDEFTLARGPRMTQGRPDHVVAVATSRTTYVTRSAPLRLTRRGRAVVLSLALAVTTAVLILFGSGVAATDDAPAPVRTVTVQPGQTLWSIAAEARPDADIRSTVDEIVRLNAIESGSKLPIGATLAVPAKD